MAHPTAKRRKLWALNHAILKRRSTRSLHQAYLLQTADCDASLNASRESTSVLARDYAGHPHCRDFSPDHL